MPTVVATAADRPDLWERIGDSFHSLWPEYNHHGDFTGHYFSALVPERAHCQVMLYETESDTVVGRARTIPFRWDGTDADLPPGIDAAGLRALEDPGSATALCALAAEVAPDHQGHGMSRRLILAMADVARSLGLGALLAPLRPTWKDRYPITPIDSYAHWRRGDGLAFDPWIRTHEAVGGVILRPEPHSLRITAPASSWELWTGLPLPCDGDYVIPGGLAPVRVADAIGLYYEPNVWMRHGL